jgi:FkbM family methyltransferase
MRKVFIDCGVREGDAIAAFLGDQHVGFGQYHKCLKPRNDARDFEFIGFESPRYKFLEETRKRFAHVNFKLREQLVWTHDGHVAFDSDGESFDCRVLEVSCTPNVDPWRHPNPEAVIVKEPCIDLSKFVLSQFDPHDYLILKMDIEGAEYDVLKHMIESNALFRLSELYVEYHWWGKTEYREAIESHIHSIPHIHYRNDWP